MKRIFILVIAFLFILSVIAVVGYSLWYLVYVPNFVPNAQVVSVFAEGELSLVIEGENIVMGNSPEIIDEEILLPIEVIRKFFDPYIYWDENLKKVTITTKDKVIRMKTETLDAIVNNEPVALNIPAIEKNGTVYIPIEFLSKFYGIEINHIKKSNVIIIDYKNRMKQIAEPLSEKAVVRKGRSIRQPIIRKFSFKDNEVDTLRVFEEYENWYRVRTWDGAIGYIKKEDVVVRWLTVNTVHDIPYESDLAWKPDTGKINLVWEMMYNRRPELSKIENMEGLDVISPTWFQLLNEKGNLINRADAKYVEWAHENGYKVWALLSNDFSDIEMTQEFLNNTDSRDTLIKELLSYASLYEIDGINIDFENVRLKDKDTLTQFVREITPFLHEQGLIVSIDVGVPDGSETYSRCYDLEALGEAVDYVMLMTYDQHWSTSPEAGSVAQYEWVEKKLKRTLETIEADKLLLGLPFYIRLWEEKNGEDGNVSVSSPGTLTMENAVKLIKENKASVVWDEPSGQFLAEYTKNASKYKIWLEDMNSINLKSSLVHKYHLAGTAAWRRGSEVPEIWMVLNENLKKIENYFEWKDINSDMQYVFKIDELNEEG